MKNDIVDNIRVRFAPSPTGFLHVGSARTAIFNWLYAKKNGGKFLLRIEDTDPVRSKSELTAQILRSLKWLGIEPEEPVIYQSDNLKRYNEVISSLVNSGKAYYAFETQNELEEKRKKAEAGNIYYKYDRASYKLPEETVKKYLDENRPYSVRFFVPGGITEFEDIVHGKTSFNNSEIDDFILLRTDGSPVYQVAVVADDHDMGITHVIRGDDHLSNTPKQILLYEALGWHIPRFAHLPMILDEQKKKLSKRRNTVSVEDYREQGILPEALFNFLTLLGFAPAENREVLKRDEIIKLFSFGRVNKKSSVFDPAKLKWINFQYLSGSDENYIAGLLKEYLVKHNIRIPDDKYLSNVIKLMRPRAETINDFYDKGKYFLADPESFDEKGITKHWNPDIRPFFTEYYNLLHEQIVSFKAEETEKHLRLFAESKGIKPSQLIHILRLALTGGTASVGIFELMEVLGKDSVINRIEKFLKINS